MNFLQQYVQDHLGWKPNEFKQAYLSMQKSYRTGQQVGYDDHKQIQAYVFTRFPATYNVCLRLFKRHLSDLPIKSILDWGCGIGTASLALSKIFDDLEYFLVEQDNQAKAYAEQFLKHFFPKNFMQTALSQAIDLTVFSYSLGEVKAWQSILDEAWPKTKYLLIIEPGTPIHFKRLLLMRDYMVAKGAHILGPCCHQKSCPLVKEDWCHFSINIERSKEHRLLKNAERGFEQEAYSYLLFTAQKEPVNFGRLVAAPRVHGGHTSLKICTQNGEIITPTIGRSSKNYKQIKKLQWGDSISDTKRPES